MNEMDVKVRRMMMRRPARFRRLDGALADLPVEHPMLLSELDGFLTGLLVLPDAVPSAEWMAVIWGPETDGVPAFEDPRDVQWFAAAVAARREEIARDLARGKLQPILDVDERNGEPLWEEWIVGFADAIALRPDAWAVLADDRERADSWSRIETLIEVAFEDSALDSVELDALHDRAVHDLIAAVHRLYGAPGGAPSDAAGTAAAKIGRNDPCPCGSVRKHKRCCG